MENNITITDLLKLAKMISADIEMEMNIETYLKIRSENNTWNTDEIPIIEKKISGKFIKFNNSVAPNFIKFMSIYDPLSQKAVQMRLV